MGGACGHRDICKYGSCFISGPVKPSFSYPSLLAVKKKWQEEFTEDLQEGRKSYYGQVCQIYGLQSCPRRPTGLPKSWGRGMDMACHRITLTLNIDLPSRCFCCAPVQNKMLFFSFINSFNSLIQICHKHHIHEH